MLATRVWSYIQCIHPHCSTQQVGSCESCLVAHERPEAQWVGGWMGYPGASSCKLLCSMAAKRPVMTGQDGLVRGGTLTVHPSASCRPFIVLTQDHQCPEG
jgi:hypothetical protein